MRYIQAAVTDIGIKRKVNQDAMFCSRAATDIGNVQIVAVCDGLGGLARGEIASYMMVNAVEDWFMNIFPKILYAPQNCNRKDTIFRSLVKLCWEMNDKIKERMLSYSSQGGGTTLSLILFIENHYYLVNVGDSRIYLKRRKFTQLTKDQTYVQTLVDKGEISELEADIHPRSSELMQCIGANKGEVSPELKDGICYNDDIFLVCTDGFRHKITSKEMENAFSGDTGSEKALNKIIRELIELNKSRMERDNISCAVVKTVED